MLRSPRFLIGIILCTILAPAAFNAHAATAQFNVGDILVSDFNANHVQQFSPSGSLIQTFQSSGPETVGNIVVNGKLFVANRNSTVNPNVGKIDVFSPSGTLTSSFSIPQTMYADDLAAFPDGVLAVTDSDGGVKEYTQAGAFVRSISIGSPFSTGDALTSADGSLWVTAETSKIMYHFNEVGTLLGSFSTTFEPRTIQIAPDNTLWIGNLNDSHIYHYNTSGQQLSTITTSLSPTESIALSPDGLSLYVTNERAASIFHYSTAGQSLGAFTVPGAQVLEYISVVAPEPTSLTFLTTAAIILRHRQRIF